MQPKYHQTETQPVCLLPNQKLLQLTPEQHSPTQPNPQPCPEARPVNGAAGGNRMFTNSLLHSASTAALTHINSYNKATKTARHSPIAEWKYDKKRTSENPHHLRYLNQNINLSLMDRTSLPLVLSLKRLSFQNKSLQYLSSAGSDVSHLTHTREMIAWAFPLPKFSFIFLRVIQMGLTPL